MKSKVLTAFLIAIAFVAGLMMASDKQQEAQASVDLSALYTQLDTMQAKLDNLNVVCERECDASSEYSLPQFKVTEFVTLTEVVTVTEVITMTDHVTEVIYIDRVYTDTVYVDIPCECEEEEGCDAPQDEPESDESESDDDTEKTPGPVIEEPAEDVPQDEPEEDISQDEPKGKCNQGVGNQDEGCDPGNSNHNQDSNDEATSDGKVPGSPGRQHNTNDQSEDKSSNKSEQPKAAKSDKVKDDKGKKNG